MIDLIDIKDYQKTLKAFSQEKELSGAEV